MSSWQNAGFIATLVDRGGQQVSKVFGYPDSGKRELTTRARRKPLGVEHWLRELAAYCDAHDLKVRVLSSPQTILRDLRGSRAVQRDVAVVTEYPEERMLQRIGRRDLLDTGGRLSREERRRGRVA